MEVHRYRIAIPGNTGIVHQNVHTAELCDGIPSDVEKAGVNFGGGRFCPWTARVVAIDEI